MKNAISLIKPSLIAIGFTSILVVAYASTPAKDNCAQPIYSVESSHLAKTVGSATLSNCKFGESKVTVTFDYSNNKHNNFDSIEIENILDISSKNPDVETYDFDKYEIAQINSALISHIKKQS